LKEKNILSETAIFLIYGIVKVMHTGFKKYLK